MTTVFPACADGRHASCYRAEIHATPDGSTATKLVECSCHCHGSHTKAGVVMDMPDTSQDARDVVEAIDGQREAMSYGTDPASVRRYLKSLGRKVR